MFLPIFVLSSFVTAGSCMFFENLSPRARCRSIFLGSKWEWLPIFFVPLQSNYDKSISSSTHAGRAVRYPAPRPCLALLLLVRHVAHGCAWCAACDRGIHTDYVLDDDQLTTQSGRIGRQRGQAIPLQTITALRRMPRHLLTGSYVMVEHGDHNISIFTPENETSFVEAVGKRVSLAKNTCQEKETES